MSIKVLHLIDSGGLYGAERMLLTLVQAQCLLGLDPLILSAGEYGIEDKAFEEEANRLGLPIKIWRMKPGLNRSETRRICRWAEAWGVDVIHTHGYKFNILMALFRDFEKVVPLVATLHGYVHAPRFSRMWAYELLDKLSLRGMSSIVLVGEAMHKELPSNLRQSPRVCVIRNGIDIENTLSKSREELPDAIVSFSNGHEPLILSVGRLSLEKGFDKLIFSFLKLKEYFPQAGLLIAGEGILRETLEQEIARHQLEADVSLPGYCNNVPALMARSKVLVISSNTEGLPITLLEALSLKLRVVSTSVGEIPKILENGSNGFLVEDGVGSLFESIKEALSNSEDANDRAERGFKKVLQDLSVESMASQYEKVYQSVLSS